MKQRILSLLVMIGVIASQSSCSKNNSSVDDPNGPPKPGVTREFGKPVGDIVKATIGPNGGTLNSKDGLLKLTVPAGALKSNTEISMQEMSNTLPGSPSGSYQLLPENIKFEKPVQLEFHYNENHLDSTVEDALHLAYQGSNGIWNYLPKTELDRTKKTLTVETDHFSYWAVYAGIYLTVSNKEVPVGKQAHLKLSTEENYTPGAIGSASSSGVAVATFRTEGDNSKIKNWKLSGAGKLEALTRSAFYTAPSKVPANNKAVVSVEIHNFIPPGVIPGRWATGKMILLQTLTIVDLTYMIGTIGDVPINTADAHHKYIDGVFVLGGNYENNTKGVAAWIGSIGTSIGEGAYGFQYSYMGDPIYQRFISYGVIGAQPDGMTYYPYCDSYGSVLGYNNSSGSLSVSKVERIGNSEYVTGTISGNFWYHRFSCASVRTAVSFDLSFRSLKYD